MTRGVLMYAHNNAEIDYLKIASANALLVKHNLNVPVTIVTDSGSYNWAVQSLGKELVDKCFDTVVIVDPDYNFDNKRSYSDTVFSTKTLQFYNCNHWQAFELSPYDETLFIDADYYVMSSALCNCWGSDADVMINHRIIDLGMATEPKSIFIDDFGIRQYWATVIYFKKTDYAKFMFELVGHIQHNYGYYRNLYYFSNGMYRNDYAFSIAIHMLNGFSDDKFAVLELPITGLLMSWDTDDIYRINGVNDITMYAAKPTKDTYTLVRVKNQDIHIMNKWAAARASDELMAVYGGTHE